MTKKNYGDPNYILSPTTSFARQGRIVDTFNTESNWQQPKLFWFANVDYPTTIPANQALMWDSATSQWKNKNISTTGTLGGLDGGDIGASPNYITIVPTVDSFYNTY
jgi:hypothetical protein